MVEVASSSDNVTCTRLSVLEGKPIYVRAEWLETGFSVAALDYPQAWCCNVTKEEVEERASNWDISVEEYIRRSRLHLSGQHRESTYSFSVLPGDKMRLSWTTNDNRNELVLKVNLTLHNESNLMDIIPGFLSAMMDATERLKGMESNRKVEKTLKARQMAMRFRAAEQITLKRRLSSQEMPRRETVRRGLEILDMEGQDTALKFNSCTLSYEPPSSPNSPTHGVGTPNCDDRVAPAGFPSSHLEPRFARTPGTPRSSLDNVEGVPRLRSPKSVIYNPPRHHSNKEVLASSIGPVQGPQPSIYKSESNSLIDCLALPLPANQTTLCLNTPSFMPKYTREPQLKLAPSEYDSSIGSKRLLVSGAEVHGQLAIERQDQCIQAPMADDYVFVYKQVGSLQLKHPVKLDESDRLEHGHLQARQQAVVRSCEQEILGSYVHIPSRPSTVNTGCSTRPPLPMLDATVTSSTQKTPTCDKGVISLEKKRRVWQNSDATGGRKGKPIKALGTGKNSTGLPVVKGHALEGVIVLSDSEEEVCNKTIKNVNHDGDFINREIQRAFELEEAESVSAGDPQEKTINELLQEAKRSFHPKTMTMITSLKQGSSGAQGHRLLNTGNTDSAKVKEEKSRWKLEREDGTWPKSLGKRKERTDIISDINNHVVDKAVKKEGSWFEQQQCTELVRLQKNKRELDMKACKGDYSFASQENEQKLIHNSDDSCKEKYPVTFNYESRAQWNTWIKEAKTEYFSPMWEAPRESKDIRNGDSFHERDERIESPQNTSPVKETLDTPPLLKKLGRNFDVFDIPKLKPKRLQSTMEARSLRISLDSELSNRDIMDGSDRRLSEQLLQNDFRQIDTNKVDMAEGISLKRVKRHRSFIQVRDSEGESEDEEEHMFEPGECSDQEEVPRLGETVVTILNNTERLKPVSQKEKTGFLSPLGEDGAQKPPSRRGRPPRSSQVHLHPPRLSPHGRPLGRPTLKHINTKLQAPGVDLIDDENSMLVLENQDLQTPVPDSDYYCFDNDRSKAHIKPNQIWALYDESDSMPRTWVRVKKVDVHGPTFQVKATWLEPKDPSQQDREWQELSGFSLSCGEFKEVQGGPSIITTLNCFSHVMRFLQISESVVQIWPQEGEIWALHRKDVKKEDSTENVKLKGRKNVLGFRLALISSICERGRPTEIQVLKKRMGYRTLWEPGYQKGPLPNRYFHLFSHKVPAYKLTRKDFPDLGGLDCWDIDAAAVPPCQSYVT